MSEYRYNPHQHACGPGDIDWSDVKLGKVVCEKCGRTWTLGDKGWFARPLTRKKPQ